MIKWKVIAEEKLYTLENTLNNLSNEGYKIYSIKEDGISTNYQLIFRIIAYKEEPNINIKSPVYDKINEGGF
jgi:hypothetical protein